MKTMISLMFMLVIQASSATILADYIFENNLRGSQAGAPDIMYLGESAVFENGSIDGFAVNAIQVELATGLKLDLSQWALCDEYSVVLHGYIDDINGYKKLLDLRSIAADSGIYNRDGFVSFVSGQEAVEANVVENEFFQLVMTRDSNDLVTIYLNGEIQLSFTDFSLATSMCFSNEFHFFIDDNTTLVESPSGAIARITIYDHKLTEEEVGNLEILDIIFADDFSPELP